MFKEELNLVPHLPGSYQMYNEYNQIIYVGKAKDLKKRLSSYFNGRTTGKTTMLINEINHFEYIVTNSELEAFILELNLIKQNNPKYNVLLTDDKSYPYIEYIKKPYPRLRVVRYLKIKKNNNRKLFGPYPNSYAARKVVDLINRIYPLKKCENMPKKVCLYYHINECLGYCVNDISIEKVEQMEEEIISFLSGNDQIIKNKINEKIADLIENLNYESAQMLKEDLNYIDLILHKQKVELTDLIDRDIINYYHDELYCCIQFFFIRHGKLIGSHNNMFPITDNVNENVEQYIAMYYQKNELPPELLITDKINNQLLNKVIAARIIVPIKGEKKQLVDLVYENAKINFNNNLELLLRKEKRTRYANEDLMNLLELNKLNRIDIFDNSNLFGNYSVSGMIVFINGLPAKKEYRKYKISLDKNDDYHMMEEVIYRRYYRVLLEKLEIPDLIIVDGGKNQINAAKKVLVDLELKIKVIGLKKDKSHSTSELLDGDTLKTITIDRHSDLFHYLTRIQDEVHRYTINYHRSIRSKGSIASSLDNIPGIGPKRRQKLIKEFGSTNAIKMASVEKLAEIVPYEQAKKIKEVLNNTTEWINCFC